MDLEADRARYEADRAKDIRLGGTHGIDEVMKAERLDAILFPGGERRRRSPRKPGYPTVIVPFAMVPNAPTPPFPDGFNAKPAPYGVSFTGMACSEPRLHRAGVRVRAGDEEARAAAVVPVKRRMWSARIFPTRSGRAGREGHAEEN